MSDQTPCPPLIPIEETYPFGLEQPSPVYLHDPERGYFKTFQWLTRAQPEWIPITELEYKAAEILFLSIAHSGKVKDE